MSIRYASCRGVIPRAFAAASTCGAALTPAGVTANGAQDGNPATHAIDGSLATRWSQLGKGSYITLDLGAPKALCGVAIAWYQGNTRTNAFAIALSTNGTTFTTVASGTSRGTTLELEPTAVTGTARYVRLTVNGNSVNDWASVTELKAYAAPARSPYPVYTKAEVDAWSTSSAEYTRLADSWAGNVSRTYAAYGTEVSSVERDVLKDESVYIKTQAVLWAADGKQARKDKVVALLNGMRQIRSWQWDSVEQYRLVAGWATTNLAQAAAIVGYRDAEFTRFLVDVNYPIMDWTGSNNWQASFSDSKLAVAVYVGDEALYADAKAYFYEHLAQTSYHSAYDGDKVVPQRKANGTPDPNMTIQTWGGYWGAPQVKADFTFVNPSYVTDGFNSETIRDLGHVSMGLGAWMHGARTILAHGDTLEKQAYDRLRAGYALHAKRVLTYKNTGTIPAPVPVKGDGGGALNQSWFGAVKLFGANTPADVVTLTKHPDVKGYASAGANHLVDEAFADGT